MQAAIDNGIYLIVDWHCDHPHLAEAQDFFAKVSAKYGKYPNIIYETWNEPVPPYDWSKTIKPYHEAVIPKIRANDAKNLIICGTPKWSQDVDKAAADPIKLDNIAYTLHFYAATHKQWLRDKAQKALDHGVALMVTECGPTEASGTGKIDLVETHAWWNFMDKNHLSWCDWSITDKDETSAALKPGTDGNGNWSLDVLNPSGKLVRDELRAKNP
jgi:endoglucanase